MSDEIPESLVASAALETFKATSDTSLPIPAEAAAHHAHITAPRTTLQAEVSTARMLPT